MDVIKQKYIKEIKTQIKEQEKWKEEALSLLTKNGIENPENHPSILKFSKKIENLHQEIDNFSEDSENYLVFLEKHSKLTHGSRIAKENKETKHFTGHIDRWAEVKKENMMKREWNWLCKMDGYVPNYMKENLRKMPNNKGYIWKGIHYYGHLSPEYPYDIHTMFEKHNQVLYIHEYGPKYYRVYEKGDRSRGKVLISSYEY
jgi:hypothetical protein